MNKAIVIDLDGTLLKTNTFISFLFFICCQALKRGDVICIGRLFVMVFLRKVRLISSHEIFKKHVLLISRRYLDGYRMEKMTLKLCRYENKNVTSILKKFKAMGYSTVLSSAAPSVYAEVIGRIYHFDFVCATELPYDKNWRENVNDQKKKNTLALLKKNSLILNVFVTDHYDDLPLLLIDKDENYVVNPTEKTKRIIEENHVKCIYIYGE